MEQTFLPAKDEQMIICKGRVLLAALVLPIVDGQIRVGAFRIIVGGRD